MFFLAFAPTGFAQTEAPRKEFTYGLNFNTNGGIIGGISLRSSKTIQDRWQQFWGLEIVEVKHPKENKYLGQGGDIFVLGKTNYMYVFRPEYGREYMFFKKAQESGVEVNAVIGVGPSVALLVPYYIDYDVNEVGRSGNPAQQRDIQRVRYDPVLEHNKPDFIIGSAGFLTGINETEVNIGAHLRTAVSFEYGRYQENITGIETGFLFEAYPKKIILLPQAQNNSVFTSVYLTIYYGRRK
ncbi:hypothetical protein [Adhaeribacter soli]|uniref:PorT family protein n=1 Tax=Adhaeribacter soli TaxID=2607655 RepID=A0A5N1IVP8_9BACT|nr:hypothetical protein [Adhaeribacter soli]KAA9332019.1 hypothetical protein F0P94_14350 [Adhaeribacter soli]